MMSSRGILSETRSGLNTGSQNGIVGSDPQLSNKLLETNKTRKYLQFNEISSSLPSYNNHKRQHWYAFCNFVLYFWCSLGILWECWKLMEVASDFMAIPEHLSKKTEKSKNDFSELCSYLIKITIKFCKMYNSVCWLLVLTRCRE